MERLDESLCQISYLLYVNQRCLERFFKSLRGLRQSDLLSPFLFIMVMEAMSRMISRAENGFLLGFVVGEEGLAISHLQYVDDTMIFCGADIRQVGYLRCILCCF